MYLAPRMTPAAEQPADRAAWDAALAECRRTQAAVHASKDNAGVALDEASTDHANAIDCLIITPAPDQSAMLVKIEFMASAYAQFAIEAMMLQALVADGRRLLVEG